MLLVYFPLYITTVHRLSICQFVAFAVSAADIIIVVVVALLSVQFYFVHRHIILYNFDFLPF